MAILCTIGFAKYIPISKAIITADPNSPGEIAIHAPDALIWKQNKQWGMCWYHDLVPLESVVKGRPEFIGSYPL